VNTYKITLLALLATLAVIGRVAFNFLPNVQPVTSIIIVCGIFLGPVSGIVLALLITFLSNMIMGTGIWTIWQIISWGIIGLTSGVLGKVVKKRIPTFVVVLLAIVSGYFYGLIISLTNYQITGQSFYTYYIAGLPFDTYHAIGNAVFMVLLYPTISYIFRNYTAKHFN
jgi:energy-coupling factor transport system substrate-specific component